MFPGLALLFWLAVGVAALASGSVLLMRGLRRRAVRDAAAGAAILACLALYGRWRYATSIDQWNPYLVREEALVGIWHAGDSELQLCADGSFRVEAHGGVAERIGMIAAEGTWDLNDWNLRSFRNGATVGHYA